MAQRKMKPAFDENYVLELTSAPDRQKALGREAFRRACQLDINAGYAAEVDEAERRLFDKEPM